MQKFKSLVQNFVSRRIDFSSVSISSGKTTLYLRFDTKDRLIEAEYEGKFNIWLSAICEYSKLKTLKELRSLSWRELDDFYKEDQSYWDAKQEKIGHVFFPEKEVFNAALSLFLGQEILYKNQSPLICRCFDVRESEVLEYLQNNQAPSLEGIGTLLKAGMGCRSCLTQLKRWLLDGQKTQRNFKNKSYSDWIFEIDYMLNCFPKSQDWKMEIKSFKNQQVIIEFIADVSQIEEEEVGKELQSFLSAGLDPDLSFFLVRARHL